MSQFQNNFNKDVKSNIAINNDRNIKIINNPENYEESKNDSFNNIQNKLMDNNEINNNIKISNLENNNSDNNNLEESENNTDDENDLEREAAILLNKQYEHIKKLKEELNIKNNEIIYLNKVIDEMNIKYIINNLNQ